MSDSSIALGTSRLFTSGTRDGAHNGACEYAELPWPPACPIAAMTSAPSSWHADAIAAHPGAAKAASGARS